MLESDPFMVRDYYSHPLGYFGICFFFFCEIFVKAILPMLLLLLLLLLVLITGPRSERTGNSARLKLCCLMINPMNVM